MNIREIERRLLEYASNDYRRIWVQYTLLSKARSEYRVVITLFPIRGQYTMLFTDTLNEISYDNIVKYL
jgi:hypothetical protein